MRTLIFALVFLFAAGSLGAAELHYEIYDFDKDGNRSLIVAGTKAYTSADVLVEQRDRPLHWSKSLPLTKEFAVGASIYREKQITGFGMWVTKDSCGFSWEWFNLEAPGKFRKLQEQGLLSVKLRGAPFLQEIEEIKFETDVSMRLNTSCEPDRITNRILVKQGSTLRFYP